MTEEHTICIKKKDIVMSLSDISGKVWCEIVCNESNCVLTLFPQNIPEEFRGKENTNTVKWQISERDIVLFVIFFVSILSLRCFFCFTIRLA